jgi:uncharacterized membrane-anchored protein YjiN (DUF445 family)
MPLPPTQPLRYDLFMIGSFRRMRAIATSALILATVAFLLSWHFRAVHPALPYVQAFSEAAMIGGLADWFAIVALFRRPFGLPIPHTAIIPANKARIGRSLGDFLANYLLDHDSLSRLLRKLDLPRHAAEIDRGPWIFELMGKVALFIEGHRGDIRDKLATHSSRWVPEWIDNKLADLLADSLIGLAFEMRAPDHPWRIQLDQWIDEKLAKDPEWLEAAAVKLLLPRRQQIADFTAQVVMGWNDEDLVARLENEVGADLHYIRLNGTLVGGLVGLVLFAVTQWLG